MIKVLSATIVRTNIDTIFIEIDCPNPVWPYKGNAVLKMECASPMGVEYCKVYFGVEPKLVDVN